MATAGVVLGSVCAVLAGFWIQYCANYVPGKWQFG
jgi:hypothetical protein